MNVGTERFLEVYGRQKVSVDSALVNVIFVANVSTAVKSNYFSPNLCMCDLR